MSEIVGRELKRWAEKLEVLSEYDITIVNILLNNYETLIDVGGTAGGKRANKIAEYIYEKKAKCDTFLETLAFGSTTNVKKIKRIKFLKVDSFRGFSVSREFNLDKQYIFFYGPNGSGKSSFSEALEFGLLGVIEEADANKIKLSAYIKNTVTKKSKNPEIICIYEDGSEASASISYDSYRFAFVEKNRITDFSHISVLNSKNQNERLAALFGLSAFNEFVQGFTTNFDDKYLPIVSATEKKFAEKKVLRDSKEEQIEVEKQDITKIKNLIEEQIAKLNKPDLGDIDSALNYVDDPASGILTKMIAERERKHVFPIQIESVDMFISQIDTLKKNIQTIRENRDKLSNMALQVDYKNLYEILSGLEETASCPACGTDLNITVRNPYKYAKMQLKTFSEIETIQSTINSLANNIKKCIQMLLDFMTNNQAFVNLLEIKTDDLTAVEFEEARGLSNSINDWDSFCEKCLKLDVEIIKSKVAKYNAVAVKSNEEYSKKVEELTIIRNSLVSLKTQLDEKVKVIEKSKKEIKLFDEKSEEELKIIQEEKQVCEFNSNMIEAYNKVVNSLIVYNAELPMQIARDLEQKIVTYYNTINQDDAVFEKLNNIELPESTSEKMRITFSDGHSSDALQVLSEGHIKILGLSILLAKAVQDNLNFLIFDDIVNAIDDDHRNGVADLLMNHQDFQNIQIILSTHGDQFISKLQDKLGPKRAKNDAIIYKFIPADSLEERGVIVEFSDSKTPLLAAEEKYNKNEIKDAASKCRQAMECIAYNLWNIIAKTSDGMISVGMRNPKSLPDLSSIVDGLIKKTNKISGMESINAELKAVKESSSWRILNKGTHFEDEQKEFERTDVKCVYDHLVSLDNLIRNIKITCVADIK